MRIAECSLYNFGISREVDFSHEVRQVEVEVLGEEVAVEHRHLEVLKDREMELVVLHQNVNLVVTISPLM